MFCLQYVKLMVKLLYPPRYPCIDISESPAFYKSVDRIDGSYFCVAKLDEQMIEYKTYQL